MAGSVSLCLLAETLLKKRLGSLSYLPLMAKSLSLQRLMKFPLWGAWIARFRPKQYTRCAKADCRVESNRSPSSSPKAARLYRPPTI